MVNWKGDIEIRDNRGVWEVRHALPKRKASRYREPNASWSTNWVTRCTNPRDVVFPRRECWCSVRTNNGRPIWSTCKNSRETTRVRIICWRWWTCFPSTPGSFPSNKRRDPLVAQALATLFKTSKRTPQKLQTDDGKEFYNKHVTKVLKDHGTHHFSTAGDTKASVVERFNRTFKQRLYRYMTTYNTFKYLTSLPKLVDGYNASFHRSIGRAPRDVDQSNAEQVWDTLYDDKKKKKKKKSGLKVGDRVRLNTKHRTFDKGYLPGWTEEVFLVTQTNLDGNVPTYRISEWDDTPIKGTFYTQDLQKVAVTDDDLFRIDSTVKRKKDKVLVRWKGWPSKYDSWINKKDLISLSKWKSWPRYAWRSSVMPRASFQTIPTWISKSDWPNPSISKPKNDGRRPWCPCPRKIVPTRPWIDWDWDSRTRYSSTESASSTTSFPLRIPFTLPTFEKPGWRWAKCLGIPSTAWREWNSGLVFPIIACTTNRWKFFKTARRINIGLGRSTTKWSWRRWIPSEINFTWNPPRGPRHPPRLAWIWWWPNILDWWKRAVVVDTIWLATPGTRVNPPSLTDEVRITCTTLWKAICKRSQTPWRWNSWAMAKTWRFSPVTWSGRFVTWTSVSTTWRDVTRRNWPWCIATWWNRVWWVIRNTPCYANSCWKIREDNVNSWNPCITSGWAWGITWSKWYTSKWSMPTENYCLYLLARPWWRWRWNVLHKETRRATQDITLS